jgi:hypothetical protein
MKENILTHPEPGRLNHTLWNLPMHGICVKSHKDISEMFICPGWFYDSFVPLALQNVEQSTVNSNHKY